MCTELFLAFLYFLTITIVNYFLFKWITLSFEKHKILLKTNKLKILFTTKQLSKFQNLSLFLKKEIPNIKNLEQMTQNYIISKDIILLSKFFRTLSQMPKNSSIYYWKLMELQYIEFES
jgi:predicted MPP superfamily phosphohydrolase